MPGIVGIIGKKRFKDNAAAIGPMIRTMMHEPFYTTGTYENEDLALCLGWVALNGSFADCMPVWNESKDVCLVFSGEHYGDIADTEHLAARGHKFDSQTASHLVHLYEELGPKFYERLNGRFGGVIVDLREKKAVLFNDRYGLFRIYYHENSAGFYFASEAKALLKVLPSLRRLDTPSLAEFFSCGCALQNRTLFAGVLQLPGGSAWIFAPERKLRQGSYFSRETWTGQQSLGVEDFYDQLKETFSRILPRYFRGRERISISLTGGLDTRMIMAWAKPLPGTLPSFTFGGMFRECEDVRVAKQVAALCRQQHQVIPVGNEFQEHFGELAEKTVYITDGAMDVSGTPDLYVNRFAREIAPVRLTGNYGGEVLRSLVAFKPSKLYGGLFDKGFAEDIGRAEETYSNELNGRGLFFVAFKQVPWHHYSRLSIELSQLTVRSPYLDNDLVALAFRVPSELATNNEVSLRLINDGSRALGSIGTDRAVMYCSTPVFSKIRNAYQEFTFKAEYAYDYGMPQWLAKIDHYLLAPLHMERVFLGRHKFYHFRLWYRDKLSDYVKEILLDRRSLGRPYLNGKVAEKLVLDHTSGRQNYTTEITKLLSMELLHRVLIDQK